MSERDSDREKERNVARARTPLIAGNWKMHKTHGEGADFVRALATQLATVTGREVVVAPPYTALASAVEATRGTCVQVAAQNLHWEREGAYTGEVSAGMLAALGVQWVIVGHSERRQLFGETDEAVARKVRAAFDERLHPIMCVGETERQREEGLTEEVLRTQTTLGLGTVDAADAGLLAIAYEPVWAIGTGKTATAETAQEALGFIRNLAGSLLGEQAGQQLRILYGGSVKPENIDELMAQPDVDGVLVGGASLHVGSFSRIVRFEERAS